MPKSKSPAPSSLFAPPPDEDSKVVQEPPKPDSETTQLLRVVLTDDEIREKSRALADKATELNQLEEDKKRASSHFGAEVKAARGEITRLSQFITSGYELREVRCEVWYHKPKPGQKTTIRTDTGETVNVQTMTSMEMQMRLPIAEEAEADAEPAKA
jgi:hypothetical protein